MSDGQDKNDLTQDSEDNSTNQHDGTLQHISICHCLQTTWKLTIKNVF